MHEIEVLHALVLAIRTRGQLNIEGKTTELGWRKCSELGGHRHSHHSQTLRRLVMKELVAANIASGTDTKPPMMYRLTEAGRDAWAEFIRLLNLQRVTQPREFVLLPPAVRRLLPQKESST